MLNLVSCKVSMKTFLRLIAIVLLACSIQSYGQKQGNIWYFGQFAGIDFNTDPPTALTGKMSTTEGCATIADVNGNLLFYSDGTSVWDKSHTIMSNGLDLGGHSSSTQSAVVIGKPGNPNIYIIFTISILRTGDGLKYSEVDMTLNGGLGNVNTVKNVDIVKSTCEKITVIQHKNERDFWVVTQLYGATENKFQTYLFTKNGISSTPVVTNLGDKIFGNSIHSIGYLKGSSDGKKLVSANTNKGTVELFDFNNATGEISNLVTLTGYTDDKPYGVEFSPNNKLLYVSETSRRANVYQYDITSGNKTTIASSRVTVGSFSNFLGALQLAPNKKIYLAIYNISSLAVIEQPNNKGIACSFKKDGMNLAGPKSFLGLPTFHNAIVEPVPDLKITGLCFDDLTEFELTSNVAFNSVKWDFGDPASTSNSSVAHKPSHKFTDSGWFHITTIVTYPTLKDTIQDSVYIYKLPKLELGNDTSLCTGETLFLKLDKPDLDFTWQDNSTLDNFSVISSGLYWVEYSAYECSNSDSILVDFYESPEVSLGNDTFMCEGEEFILLTESKNAKTFKWQDNSTLDQLKVSSGGTYIVTAFNTACEASDTIEIKEYKVPKLELGKDTALCIGDTLKLQIDPLGNPVLWNDGSTSSSIVARGAGIYKVTVKADLCSVSDSITIIENRSPDFDLSKDTILCIGKTKILEATCLGGIYFWNDGSTDSILEVSQPGTYWVSATNNCDSKSDTVTIKEVDCTCYLKMANAFTPNHDNLNETFSPTYISCQFREYHFQVYSLWGEQLFSSRNQFDKWDGTYKGKIAQNGTYVYVLNYIDQDGIQKSLKGTVTLLR